MLRYKTGDIFKQDAEALVNTVNCVGFMGRGVALQFKKAFPENFKAYAALCKRGEMRPGHVFVFATGMLAPKYIINFPTKRHWRGKSRMEDIEAGLVSLVQELRVRGISSVAIPALGSGLGGLPWGEVRTRLEKALMQAGDVKAFVFEPESGPQEPRANRSRTAPKLTPARATLVGLMDRYLRGLLDPFVTLLEVHKLMYFMQEAGEPLRLQFAAERHGPYAETLRHVLHQVEGHWVCGYADGGDAPGKELQLVPGATEEAHGVLADQAKTQARFERVCELVDGFESPFGLELLATVHWVVHKQNPRDFDALVHCVYAWDEGKRQFSPRQIKIAANVLSQKGWLGDFKLPKAAA